MTAMAARKQTMEGGDPGADIVGDSPASVIPGMVDGGVAAWQEDGATDGKTQFGPGEYDAAMAAQITLFEEVVHGWDLAKATGQSLDVPSDLADASLATAQMICNDDSRASGFFGAAVDTPAGSGSFDQALALTGRDPGWTA